MATKRSRCWVDYDSDSDTEGDHGHGQNAAPSTAATTPASAAMGVATDSEVPQPKRRRVNAQQPSSLSETAAAGIEVDTTYTGITSPSRPTTATATPTPTAEINTTSPTGTNSGPERTPRDLLSPLSDELLLRILSFLSLPHLLAVAPVSRRFYHLASDSQLWKALYYARFVLPRAMRIPGFRDGVAAGKGRGRGSGPGHKLHYSGRRTLWADGRRGGVVDIGDEGRRGSGGKGLLGEGVKSGSGSGSGEGEVDKAPRPGVNWKRQFKIRYNWSRGKCAVEELRIGGEGEGDGEGESGGREGRRVLVKVVEGVAITADELSGLRAWDLKTRKLLAQVDTGPQDGSIAPSCIAIDEKQPDGDVIDVSLGFVDGSFGVWRLFPGKNRIEERYRHEKSSNGELIAVAFSYPYLLTATELVLISLYTFDVPDKAVTGEGKQENDGSRTGDTQVGKLRPGALSAPYLLTSLKSHTSRPPLALSIRKMTATTIASIAYTFSTRQGWSIGVQDLHIHPSNSDAKSTPEITTTRIAYTTPIDTGGVGRFPPSPPATPRQHDSRDSPPNRSLQTSPARAPPSPEPGPTSLCYTHPYLLATLPDNTLILHMCTSNASSLSISSGIRLWGHTSGISDAEITARGKAVSVSTRGEEMRVWELEGRSSGIGSRSVEIRPGQSPNRPTDTSSLFGLDGESIGYDWEERRNWVGFDDEMVIVLKEKKGGRESLMVYDFT